MLETPAPVAVKVPRNRALPVIFVAQIPVQLCHRATIPVNTHLCCQAGHKVSKPIRYHRP
jgi:hypothetical protein